MSTKAVHTVAGNADRMRSGPLTVRLDDAWTTGAPDRQPPVGLRAHRTVAGSLRLSTVAVMPSPLSLAP